MCYNCTKGGEDDRIVKKYTHTKVVILLIIDRSQGKRTITRYHCACSRTAHPNFTCFLTFPLLFVFIFINFFSWSPSKVFSTAGAVQFLLDGILMVK